MCGGCEDCAALDKSKPRYAWEGHITVEAEWEDFRSFCDKNKIKAIRVEDLIPNTNSRISYMTSHKIISDDILEAADVWADHCYKISDNFKVVRKKLEMAPWCRGVPKTSTDFVEIIKRQADEEGYFEVHLQINQDTDEIRQKLWDLGLHLSRNVDKQDILMATFRRITWLQRFEKYVDETKKSLFKAKLPVDPRVIIEYTAYDTNKQYDQLWMST